MTDVYVHSFSPFLIQFTDSIGIRWYGLSYLAGFVTVFLISDYLAKRNLILIRRETVADFITYGALGTLIGGRLGYCLFYKPELFLDFHAAFPFWGAIEVHKGGMASHGGLIGIMAGSFLFARREKIPWQHVVDVAAFGGLGGVIYGRIANFINGELYGREAPEGLWWAVKFPTEILSWRPTDLELVKKLGPAVEALGKVSSEEWNKWMLDPIMNRQNIENMFYSLVEATQQGQAAVVAAIGPALTARYPSQLIQAGLEGLLVWIILIIVWMRPQKPGVVSATFGFSYAVTRIIGEQYRLPDSYIGFELFGLTRGQWLSIGLVGVAAAYLFYAINQKTNPVGGWSIKGDK